MASKAKGEQRLMRDPKWGDEKFVVMHWDTFDDTVFRVGGAETMHEALRLVADKYKGKLSDKGADRVEIVNHLGDIVYRAGVK
jgi:hypothetical protein